MKKCNCGKNCSREVDNLTEICSKLNQLTDKDVAQIMKTPNGSFLYNYVIYNGRQVSPNMMNEIVPIAYNNCTEITKPNGKVIRRNDSSMFVDVNGDFWVGNNSYPLHPSYVPVEIRNPYTNAICGWYVPYNDYRAQHINDLITQDPMEDIEDF